MRRDGIIHGELARALADLRHTDLLVVSDSGLPIPPGPRIVDLAVVYGLPRFAPVLDAVLNEIVIEAASMSEPVRERNPDAWELVRSRLPQVDTIPHDELKELAGDARLVIRTGEATPFANVLLRCGVPF